MRRSSAVLDRPKPSWSGPSAAPLQQLLAVGLEVVGSAEERDARHRLGAQRLVLLGLDAAGDQTVKRVVDGLSNTEKLQQLDRESGQEGDPA